MGVEEGVVNPVSASLLAAWAHHGQTDKAGRPYVDHPRRVAERLQVHPSFLSLSEAAQDTALVAAWLHDVVEDTRLTISLLAELGVHRSALLHIDRLTRHRAQDPANYYAAIRSDPVSRLVKECDIADNSDPRRLARLPLDVQKKLVRKYTTACTLLGLNPEEVGLPHEG